jgi:hypothetical protein
MLLPLHTPPGKTDREKYLDWVNNFLTVERFAEYYGMTEDAARTLIDEQRALDRAA